MKKKITIILLIISGAFSVEAQMDTNLTKKFLLNFSIPDNPAFNALGISPSNILRPSDIQKFSASLAPFYSNGQGVIPKNFALEIAPWKLASKSWTLNTYNKPGNSFLYNSAFSIGTVKDTGVYGTKLSIGYRVSLQSKNADILKVLCNKLPSNDTDINRINRAIYAFQTRFNDFIRYKNEWIHHETHKWSLDETTKDKYFKNNQAKFVKYIDSISKLPGASQTLKDDVQGYDTLFSAKRDYLTAILSTIDSTINKFKTDHWNGNRFDLAFAWVGESSDSLAKNTRFSSFNAWMTWAIGIGTSGQLLLGGSMVLPRSEKTPQNDTTKMVFTQNIRFYEGTADIRGFIESQYKYQNYDAAVMNTLLFNLGAEFRMGTFWVVASTGVNNYLAEKNPWSKLEANLDLRYSFNK